MGVFHFPVKIVSAPGCLKELPEELNRLGAHCPLIVTDPGITKAGIVDRVTRHLKDKDLPFNVFDGVEPDPKLRNAVEAANAVKKGGHDLIIGLGGGSSIDTAKASAILSTNKIDLGDFQGPRASYPEPPLPLVTIPTTAGTGSEVSSAAVIVNEEKKYKMFFKSPEIFSKVAFLDADVLVGVPSQIAAETGADTLSHALESFFNPNGTFITEKLSFGSIELIFLNLRAFVANTADSRRAQNMLNASCLAGIAMTTAGLGLVHALAHPIGVRGRIGHGLACALLLPHVLHFNWPVDPDRFLKLASAIDWTIRVRYPSARQASLEVINEIKDILSDIGLPRKLSEIGVSLDDPDTVIDEAYGSFLNQVNPRPASRKDLEKIVSEII